MMFLLGLTYSCYALYVSIAEPTQSLSFSNFSLKLSYAPIIQNIDNNDSLEKSVLILGWLLSGVVVIWMFSLSAFNWAELKHKRMIDNNTITAADFSIMIENIPYRCSDDQLQQAFNLYYQELADKKFIKD